MFPQELIYVYFYLIDIMNVITYPMSLLLQNIFLHISIYSSIPVSFYLYLYLDVFILFLPYYHHLNNSNHFNMNREEGKKGRRGGRKGRSFEGSREKQRKEGEKENSRKATIN